MLVRTTTMNEFGSPQGLQKESKTNRKDVGAGIHWEIA